MNLDLVDEYALNEKLTGQFDELQSIGKCCGITDWADFIKTPWSRMPENELTVWVSKKAIFEATFLVFNPLQLFPIHAAKLCTIMLFRPVI